MSERMTDERLAEIETGPMNGTIAEELLQALKAERVELQQRIDAPADHLAQLKHTQAEVERLQGRVDVLVLEKSQLQNAESRLTRDAPTMQQFEALQTSVERLRDVVDRFKFRVARVALLGHTADLRRIADLLGYWQVEGGSFGQAMADLRKVANEIETQVKKGDPPRYDYSIQTKLQEQAKSGLKFIGDFDEIKAPIKEVRDDPV